MRKIFKAFTLAETLIAIAIIGVVAAVTIPAFISKTNEKEFATAREIMNSKILEAMNQMRAHGDLTGYTTAEDFVNGLKKYMKITRVCASSELEKCFAHDKVTDDTGKSVDVSKMSSSSKIIIDKTATYPANTAGIQFANGVTGILTYRIDCPWLSPLEGGGAMKAQATQCLSMVYDINGGKKPNKAGQDVAFINAKLPGLCAIELDDGTCFNALLLAGSYSPLTLAECNDKKGELGISNCYESDYWGGAVKVCGGISKMPTNQQLTDIASKLYGKTCSNATGLAGACTGTFNYDIGGAIGFPSDTFSNFFIWSGVENGSAANYRVFNSGSTMRNVNATRQQGSIIHTLCKE